MPYGFSIWDDDDRLILWNRRYVEIYDLPAGQSGAGHGACRSLRGTVAAGNHPGARPRPSSTPTYRKRLRRNRAATAAASSSKSGPATARSRPPICRVPGLGWVVTHEDITEQELHEARTARRKNLRLDAALNSMAHGFSHLRRSTSDWSCGTRVCRDLRPRRGRGAARARASTDFLGRHRDRPFPGRTAGR